MGSLRKKITKVPNIILLYSDTNEFQHGQSWDDDPRPIRSSTMLSTFVNTSQEEKGRKTMMESSTQTPSPLEKNETNMKLANESFGRFVGLELSNISPLKRRYVMYEIIKLFENCG